MNFRKLAVLLIYLFLTSTAVFAEEAFDFNRITVDDGLSQNTVLDIHQDANGFIWLGTQDGLNRYDGYNHLIFRHDPDNPNSLSDNRIRCIYTDSEGTLWIGSEGGLSRYDQNSGDFINYNHNPDDNTSLGHNTVRAIFEDHKGTLWIGTRGGGLNRFDKNNETFDRYLFNPDDPYSIGSNAISSITEDSAGNLWVGTFKGGVSRFDPSRKFFTRFTHDPNHDKSLSHNKIIEVYRDRNDTIWIGTYGGGLNQFDPKNDGFLKYRKDPNDQFSISSNRIRSIYEDETGTLLVGTNAGLNLLDQKRKQFSIYQHDPSNPKSLTTNTIQSIYQDLSGVIWLGTSDGINQIVPKKKFHNIGSGPGQAENLSHSSVSAIVEEEENIYWVGTNGGGLNLIDLQTGTNRIFSHDRDDQTSLSSNDVRAVLKDRTNRLWAGTYIGGLNRFDENRGTFEHFLHNDSDDNSISGNNILDIKEDQEGILWIGTNLNGLNSFDPATSKFTHYRNNPNDPGTISSNRVWSVFVDSNNVIWAGTYGAGLNRFDRTSKKFTRYKPDPDKKKSLSNNVVLTMYEDSSGNLWIGTQGGLNRFEPSSETFTRYTEKDGLTNNVINGIQEDSEGNLWLSTNKGISKYTPQTGTFHNYSKGDGLKSNEYNPGASIQARDDTIVFGGRKGLTYFSPNKIIDNQYIPPVEFTSFNRGGEKLNIETLPDGRKQIELNWRENHFEFSFVALNYILPDQNQYAYVLEGLDDDWYFAENNHQGRYSSIPPGSYILKIKGSNNDGIWNDEAQSIHVLVSPPPWKTQIAYLLYTLVALGSLLACFITVNTREKRKVLEKKRLEDLVISRTDELRLLNKKQQKEIDERKIAEARLGESERKLSTLISNLPGMAYRCRNKNGWPMEFISDGCLSVTGYPPLEISGDASLMYGDIIYPADRQTVWDTVQESIRNNEPFELEYRILSKDGDIKWVWEKGCVVSTTTQEETLIEGFVSDITQQKSLAKGVQQSQKMEAIGTLAGGIAHDFNNILSAIIGYTEIVLDDIPKGSEQEDSLNEVLAAGFRAKELVKQILAFAQQTDEELKPIRLRKLIEEVMKLLHPSTPTTIEIISKLESQALVMGNESQLHQIILNLCTNSSHAMQENGGTLQIGLRDIQIGTNHLAQRNNLRPGQYVELTVTDNGLGIKPEIIGNIFEPYFTTKDVGEGSGMGLAMVKGIVETYRGDIHVTSRPGEKTVFTVRLPVSKGQDKENVDRKKTLTVGSEHLLFVDDEPAIAKMGFRLLENLGYKVTYRTSSVEALELFKKRSAEFDLVLTDMTMPFLTGDELAMELRKVRPDIPIIICTGYSSRLNEREAKDLGINAFAYKPFTKEDFSKTIREVLDSVAIPH